MQPAAQAKIAPESTSRPDWQFFADVLGKPREAPPAGREQACARLKELLLETTGSEETYRALVMKCGAFRIASFVADNPRISSGMVLGALMSRLYDASKGGVGHESGKPSSGCVMESWDPSKSGIVPYLSTHISWQLKREVRHELCPTEEVLRDGSGERVNLFSIEHLQERGIDMSSNGTLVRRMKERFDDVAPAGEEEGIPAKGDEVVELNGETPLPAELGVGEASIETDGLTPSERERLEEEKIEAAALRAAAAPQDEASPEDEAVFADHMAAAEWLALAQRRPSRDLLASGSRPEYRMFSIALGANAIEPEATQEGRAVQLRSLASSVLEAGCWAHPEYHELVEAVNEWNPGEKSFGEQLPDVVDIVAEHLMPGSVSQKNLIRERNQEQLVFTTFREALNKTKSRQEPMIEIDGEQVPLRDVLRPRRGDEVDLEESGRPDHFLLCHLLSAEFKDLHGPALHAHMRSMGKEFTSRTIPGMASILRDRTSELAEWDPATSLLGEHYLDVLERAETERLAADQARNRSQEGEDPAMGNGPRPALQPGAPGLVTSPGPLVGPKKKEPDLGLSFSP